jgi:hypothetical protein
LDFSTGEGNAINGILVVFAVEKPTKKGADISNTIKLRNRKGSPFGRAPAEGG